MGIFYVYLTLKMDTLLEISQEDKSENIKHELEIGDSGGQ